MPGGRSTWTPSPASRWRRLPGLAPRASILGPNREILWFNRTAGKWLGLRRKVDYCIRIDNLVLHPDFVEYLDKRGALAPPRIHLPKQGDRGCCCAW